MILWVEKCQETGSIFSEQRRSVVLGMELWDAVLEGGGSKMLVLVVLRSNKGKTPKENKAPEAEAEETTGRQSSKEVYNRVFAK